MKKMEPHDNNSDPGKKSIHRLYDDVRAYSLPPSRKHYLALRRHTRTPWEKKNLCVATALILKEVEDGKLPPSEERTFQRLGLLQMFAQAPNEHDPQSMHTSGWELITIDLV